MISPVYFQGSIKNYFCGVKKANTPCVYADSFEESEGLQLRKAAAKAKTEIIDTLKKEGVERAILLSKDGEIILDKTGDKNHVDLSYRGGDLPKGSISLHGHPEYLPLSPADIANLMLSNLEAEEAVMDNGDFSRLTKGENWKPDSIHNNGKPDDLRIELETSWQAMIFDKLGIDHSVKPKHIIDIYRDYKKITEGRDNDNLTDKELYEELKDNFNIDANMKDAIDKIKILTEFAFAIRGKYFDLEYGESGLINKITRENEEKIANFCNSNEGYKARQQFVKDIAKKYGLTYETNMTENMPGYCASK